MFGADCAASQIPGSPDLIRDFEARRGWAVEVSAALSSEIRIQFARTFSGRAILSYWRCLHGCESPIRPFHGPFTVTDLSRDHEASAEEIGRILARLPSGEAGYLGGTLYTSLLPSEYRATFGAYYTPPSLVRRLIETVSEQGFDWCRGTILDPACGGAAFLAPVVKTVITALRTAGCSDELILDHLAGHVRGLELDPFAAWLSMVLVDVVVKEAGLNADTLPDLVTVGDALECCSNGKNLLRLRNRHHFDLVIGNPPYGRISLDPKLRKKYARSLYGHANLYGLFTDMALRLTARGSTVAFVTPTSFLGGQYFKKLRSLLLEEAAPVAIDFIEHRTGVFEDVLQETLLAVFERARVKKGKTRVACVTPRARSEVLDVKELGQFDLPVRKEDPWVFPRSERQNLFLSKGAAIKCRLSDYGFTVSTGPLVWNRHKDQLTASPGGNHLPLIWAEAVSPKGEFQFTATKRNHQPYFRLGERQNHLVTKHPCLLLQRTTAKEQNRRLIAALLPEAFLAKHQSGVVIENHLNVVKPVGRPRVSIEALWALFNSDTLDDLFRCINGSVAVSAYELNALPLPTIENALRIAEMMREGCTLLEINDYIRASYTAV